MSFTGRKEKKGERSSLRGRALVLLGLIVMVAYVLLAQVSIEKSSYSLLNPNLRLPSIPNRPFRMPLSGDKWSLFQPFYDMDKTKLGSSIFAPPKVIVNTFSKRIEWLDTAHPIDPERPISDRAHEMYLEMLKSFLTATLFNEAEKSVRPSPKKLPFLPFDLARRQGGLDWTYLGDTMTGWKRLDNVWELLKNVVNDDIPGDYIETGVWRGGCSVFARAVLYALGQEEDRQSYVCDSFAGLPPGDRDLDAKDKNWDAMHWYLAIPEEIVAQNFQKYGLLDQNVIFAKGFFNETMPQIKKYHSTTRKFSVMRLDGDMYESTVDVLYNLYDKLSIGGYVIMDDWYGFPSKTACEDFFQVHGIKPEIIQIDRLSAYWKKTEEVDIQFWRYKQNKFN